jgi:hypothetical protein
MNKKEKEHFESLDIKTYGSVENKNKFYKGIENIENINKDFFKDKGFDENELVSYFGYVNTTGNLAIDFREDRKLPKEIEKSVSELFRECFS